VSSCYWFHKRTNDTISADVYYIIEDLKFDVITAESLRQEKGYAKATKKQQKEVDAMRKRHLKERMVVQKQQCVAIEKAIKGKK